MLYKTQGLGQDQILTDLLAVKERLRAGWVKGTFVAHENVCIVAACEKVLEMPIGFTQIPVNASDRESRLARLIGQIYTTLYGPKAPTDIGVSSAMQRIAAFNDSSASTHESVLMLLDRAIAAVLEPATVAG